MKKTIHIVIFTVVILLIGTFFYKDHKTRNMDKQVVRILNKYPEVDRVRVKNVNTGKEETINYGPEIVDYLIGLEPRKVLYKEKSEIRRNTGKQILEARFYIGEEELFQEKIYPVSNGSVKGAFKVGESYYVIEVLGEFREINNNDMSFLEEILKE